MILNNANDHEFRCSFIEGFGVLRAPGLVNFSPRISGIAFKSCGFSGLEMCCGLGHFVSGISLKIPILSGFRSHTVHAVNCD